MGDIPTPLSEPPWLCGHPSPYYNDSHRQWQEFCREFIYKELNEHAQEWEAEGEVPEEVWSMWHATHVVDSGLTTS